MSKKAVQDNGIGLIRENSTFVSGRDRSSIAQDIRSRISRGDADLERTDAIKVRRYLR